ncbi:glycine--tRNA ligase [Methanofollis aquaemaris]|uniref:glycine--tRNA ligase n=1 Tax=Methanofollis aquaemaris TaxID=126734 RepID=A0A8A3S3L9_9EURY|nr:glycine--tRNA ligase [Methanofollis aquaemaris]QSZ66652.1 glycine--tRNA ligase [Methanofollis aquaemaris]
MSDIYDKVIELAKRRGFVWPSAELYGAVAGFIDYGPLGAMMKRRIENIWRRYYVIREGYYEIECPTVGTESIYLASGHVKGFADKMCQCPHCNEYFRADHLAEACGIENGAVLSREELAAAITDAACPSCGETFGQTEVFDFNLMFQTTIGPGSQRKGYLRPETAQGIFTDFSRLSRFYRQKLPFGAVQIGKSYRNEISPRQGMIRLREFTQAEAEIFVNPQEKTHPAFSRYADYPVDLWGIEQQQNNTEAITKTMRQAVDEGIIANEYIAYYLALTHELMVAIGVDPKRTRFRQHLPDERAHYAIDCWDAEVYSGRFGWVEIVGIADRTDYDLRAHAAESGDSMTVFVPFAEARRETRKRIVSNMGVLGPKYRGKAAKIAAALAEAMPGPDGAEVVVDGETIFVPGDLYTVSEEEVEVRGAEVMPHVIEPSYGIDRMIYSVLEHAYDEEEIDGEVRKVLRLAPCIAPVQVAVFPLVNKDGLDVIAREITADLQDAGVLADYDDNGAIGRRYRRQDEVGTPFAVTVDTETKDAGTVTLRDRDSMEQVRVRTEDLVPTLLSLIRGRTIFADLKKE